MKYLWSTDLCLAKYLGISCDTFAKLQDVSFTSRQPKGVGNNQISLLWEISSILTQTFRAELEAQKRLQWKSSIYGVSAWEKLHGIFLIILCRHARAVLVWESRDERNKFRKVEIKIVLFDINRWFFLYLLRYCLIRQKCHIRYFKNKRSSWDFFLSSIAVLNIFPVIFLTSNSRNWFI